MKESASNVLSQATSAMNLRVHFLPLDCAAGGGGCVPLLPEEKEVVVEVRRALALLAPCWRLVAASCWLLAAGCWLLAEADG